MKFPHFFLLIGGYYDTPLWVLCALCSFFLFFVILYFFCISFVFFLCNMLFVFFFFFGKILLYTLGGETKVRKIIGYKERSGVLDNGRPWSHVMVYTTYPSDRGTGDECEQVKVNPIVWDRFISEYGDPLGLEVDVYYNKFGKVELIQVID